MKLWDPYAVENSGSPYAMYDRLRQSESIHQTQTGDFVVTGFKEVRTLLLDQQRFRVGNRYEWIARQVAYLESKEENLSAITAAMDSFLVQMNAPEHTVIRNLVVDAWDNHEVENIIQENVAELLKQAGNEFDLIKDFASPLPVMTMARIMGMPKNDYQYLKSLSADLLLCLDMYTSFKTLVQIDRAAQKFIAYVNDYLDFRSQHLGDDLVSKVIILAQKRDLPLSRKQLISICIFLFMAGEETTINLIGTGFWNLYQKKLLRPDLFSDSKSSERIVNEALRYDSPVQLVGRIANVDVQLGDLKIPKESTLTLSLGAANRDPSVFPSPHTFDIHRDARNHLAFGAGAHFCLGSWLAKLQWKMAIDALIKFHPPLRVSGEAQWNSMLSIRGLISLPVVRH